MEYLQLESLLVVWGWYPQFNFGKSAAGYCSVFNLRLWDNRVRAVQNVLGNVYLISLTKNLWYEEREELDSGGGGALSQGAGHDGSFYRYAV